MRFIKSTAALVAIAAATISTTGCATVLKSKQTSFQVKSTTPGAEVLVNGEPVGVTPANIELSTKRDHEIVVRRGSEQQTCRVSSSASVGWIVLDVLTAAGWIVDLATDNWNNLDKTECNVAI
ncbi:MAG: PEGA domain-containing protein [Kofleriaceae bacterium]